jgi:2-polyprenyl-3-methyl-5-hydroxy-6-metoxy-1,4-benzoquinol methylase
MDAVVRLEPRSVLDVGVGYGKWGFLVREALDFMHGRHARSEFRVRIDGLEAFAPTSSPLYEWVYDRVTFADVADVVDELPAYDLVIMGDVIEHMPKEVGIRVLESLLKASRNVVVVTPADFFQQEVLDNPWEHHKSLWTRSDFARWPYDFQMVGSRTRGRTISPTRCPG